jgi:hypothetical protein
MGPLRRFLLGLRGGCADDDDDEANVAAPLDEPFRDPLEPFEDTDSPAPPFADPLPPERLNIIDIGTALWAGRVLVRAVRAVSVKCVWRRRLAGGGGRMARRGARGPSKPQNSKEN